MTLMKLLRLRKLTKRVYDEEIFVMLAFVTVPSFIVILKKGLHGFQERRAMRLPEAVYQKMYVNLEA